MAQPTSSGQGGAMAGKASQTVNRIQALYMAPFQATIPLWKVSLWFALALVLAAHWRLILDRIDLEVPQ